MSDVDFHRYRVVISSRTGYCISSSNTGVCPSKHNHASFRTILYIIPCKLPSDKTKIIQQSSAALATGVLLSDYYIHTRLPCTDAVANKSLASGPFSFLPATLEEALALVPKAAPRTISPTPPSSPSRTPPFQQLLLLLQPPNPRRLAHRQVDRSPPSSPSFLLFVIRSTHDLTSA